VKPGSFLPGTASTPVEPPRTYIPKIVRVDRRPICIACTVVSAYAVAARKRFRAQGLWCLDAFVGLSFCGTLYSMDQVVDAVNTRIDTGARSIEMMTHPGFVTYEAPIAPDQYLVPEEHYDSFSRSDDRLSELRVLCDPRFPTRFRPIVRRAHFVELLSGGNEGMRE
jgi:hypothetical protein